MRSAEIERKTGETDIRMTLCLDGGARDISTGIGFFDHMLTAFSVHGGFGLELSVSGSFVRSLSADGLIISTPTGSTAYGLSNGGPIIVPTARNLCLTPVAPHSLNIRPIVINDDSEIRLEVESRSHNFLVAIDGRSEKLLESTRLTIRKAPYYIKIVKRRGQRYFSTLREKMMWGADQR